MIFSEFFGVLLICAILPHISHAFNLDLASYKRYSGQPGSMFGFSIALHPTYSSKWVIIGAPRGNTGYQRGVDRAGAVYKCEFKENQNCTMVPFDSKGNQFNEKGEQIDSKSDQWLGATVASSGKNGVIVACAPRYVFHSMQPTKTYRIEPVGTCFTSRNFTSFKEFSPCRTENWGYHRQGSCQAGFSAALTKTGDRLFIGAPGSWYWQGQAYSINPDEEYPFKPPRHQDYGIRGQTYSYDITDERSKVFASRESKSKDDDTYLGYSMVTGDFNGDGEEDVAIGMPRGSELLGRVVLYKWNMTNILNITGWQIGAYFGYSMCTADVNGDKLDDLIISAPMYSEQNNEGKYEVGRVYVMLQGRHENYVREEFRDGTTSRGRFGLSLASLGDINLDGYGDFAVGAPYGGPNGRGAVYIFHGSQDGPLAKPSQVIFAEDVVGFSYPRTFGFSLSGGVDLDGNLYPDLAVGAYDSDDVIIFKSRPVAKVDASTAFTASSKLISLDKKHCTIYKYGKQEVACTEIVSCLKYTGINLPSILEFQVSWVLDVKKPRNPRLFFLLDEGKNIRNSSYILDRGMEVCRNETVYLVDNIRDKLTPLEVEMRYRIKPTNRRKRDVLDPVIDHNREIIQKDSIHIQNNCGADNICVPNLRLDIKTVEKYLLGSREPLSIDILITNVGEDAFEASFSMNLPNDLDFKKILQIGNSGDSPITCTAPTILTNNTLKCDIGNPLPAGKIANFKVVMMPSKKIGMAPTYDFYMEANSTNQESHDTLFDNKIKKSINIWVESELSITGTSLPDFEHYKASDFKSLENATTENDLGPQVVHIYNIRNNGPSSIDEAVIYIYYPCQTHAGDTLMYLLNQPETDGNIQCEPNINVNTRNLKLDQTLSHRSFLQVIGAVVKTSETTSAQRKYHVEQSIDGAGNSVNGNTVKYLSEEQRRKLAEEDNLESTGDASFVHSQRAKDAAASIAGHQRSNSYSFNSSSNKLPDSPLRVTQHSGINNIYSPTSKSDMAKLESQSFSDLQNAHIEKNSHTNNFRTGNLDLGALSRNNVDDEIRYQTTVPRYYTETESRIYRPNSENNFGTVLKETYHNSRQKREFSDEDLESAAPCKAAKCAVLRCVVKQLGNNEDAWIASRTRLVAATLEKLASNLPLNVSTMAVAEVTRLPYIGRPADRIIKSHEIFYKAIPEPIPIPDVVPLWVVVLSACIGAIILLLLVFLLYKCGFFKRNRPIDNSHERQPLRNGYHGDEHL